MKDKKWYYKTYRIKSRDYMISLVFSKGIVQSVIPLSDGTAVKLTIAKYFTPNGNDIHKKGITPDYEVELPDGKASAVNIDRADDTQLQKAQEVIAEMLNN